MTFIRTLTSLTPSFDSEGRASSLLSRHSSQPFQNSSFSSVQTQVDGLVSGFVSEASNPITLTAMVAGGMAYRVGRIGVMGMRVGAYCNTPLRITSMMIGLGSEVTAFELTKRSLISLSLEGEGRGEGGSGRNLWSWAGDGGWAQGLTHSAVTFGLLRGAGFLTREQNLVFQHAFQSAALVIGRNGADILGVGPRPEGSLAEQFLHAEITNLQLSAGMGLVHFLAPGIHAWERSLDLSLNRGDAGALIPTPLILDNLMTRNSAPLPPNFATEGWEMDPQETHPQDPLPIVFMSTGGKDGDGEGPNKPRRPFLQLISSLFESPPETEQKETPSSDEVLEFDLGSRRMIREFEGLLIELMDRREEVFDRNLKREQLQTLLQEMARTSSSSDARNHLVQLPRYLMARVLEALRYFDPPPPSLRVVDRFYLLPEVRHFLEEIEARRAHGEAFVSYAHLEPENVSVVQIDDGVSSSLFLESPILLGRRHLERRPLTPILALKSEGKRNLSRLMQNKEFVEVLHRNLERVTTGIPRIRKRFGYSPIIRLDLTLWSSRTFLIERDRLEELLHLSLKYLMQKPEGAHVPRVTIHVRGRGVGYRLDYLRGNKSYVLEEPGRFDE